MLTIWVAVYDNICETGVLPETPGFRSQRTLAQGINNLSNRREGSKTCTQGCGRYF